MRTVPALTERTERERWREVRDEDDVWGDLRPELLEAVRSILTTTMEDELAAELVATRYERTPWRRDTRNGAYHRTLVTELGAIIDLRVPRRRLVPYRPSFLVRAARRTRCVDRVLRQAFLRGLSTRETAALAETLAPGNAQHEGRRVATTPTMAPMKRRPTQPKQSGLASRPGGPAEMEVAALTSDQLQAISRFPDENPNPVLRIGVDGRVLYANPASAGILTALGVEVGGMVARGWLAAARAAAVEGTILDISAGHRTFAVRPVEIADLGFLNVYGTDITAQRAIVKFPDQNPNPVFRMDWDGRLVYANPASTELIEGLGCRIGGTLSTELFERLIAAVRGGTRESVEIASRGRDYALLPVDVPEFGFINVYGTDVTAQNQIRRLHFENQRLLLNILPEAIADRLRGGETLIADRFDDVTLLFADIVGFTAMSSAMSPHELVGILNEVFTVFDDLVEHHDLEKVKTIGDAYMVIGGLLDQSKNHTERVADLALDLSARLDAIEAAARLGVQFRIGINCGPVVAGVIGTRKFIYDVWGDTVNLAARMESLGVPGRIQVSGAVEERLRGRYQLEARGLIDVKGKGSLPTWFLTGGPNSARATSATARRGAGGRRRGADAGPAIGADDARR